MKASEYQSIIESIIEERFTDLEVSSEWRAFTNMSHQYSPRVDIAIGPYNVNPGPNRMEEYNQIIGTEVVHQFLRDVYNNHINNIESADWGDINIPEFDELVYRNANSRCLVAIEIENSSTKKHIMGSMINAASLGRVGIGIAYNDSVLRTFIRMLHYMAFLKRVEKNTYDTTNFLIVTKDQFIDIVK